MAAGDTAHWLQNKLGLTDDLWSGRTICAQLSADRLQSIRECFPTLFPHVKVKLLLSFLHLPRRNIEQWQDELKAIIKLALSDGPMKEGGKSIEDSWVTMVGKILRHFPETGALNLDLEEESDYFKHMLESLKHTAERVGGGAMLPLECQYLNKKALDHTTGQIPQFTRYFQIKRKPKSATLRAEIVSKSSEVAANKKKNMPNSVPIKSRSFLKKMDTTTPMRGIPSRAPPSSKFHSSPSSSKHASGPSVTVTPLGNTWVTNRPGVNRKEGGVKFLDIGEQPVGAREAKKRKRQADLEALEQQKKAKMEAAAAAASAAPSTVPQSITPDYAAGLMAPATPKMPTPLLSTTATLTVQGPSYVPSTARAQPTQTTAATLGGVGALSTQQQARNKLQNTLQNTLVATTTTVVRPTTVSLTTQTVTAVSTIVATAKPTVVTAAAATTTAVSGPPTQQPTTIIVQASPQLLKQQQGQKLVATQVRLPAGVQLKGQPGVVGAQTVQVRLAAPPVTVTPQQPQQQPQQQQQQQPQQQQPTLSTVATQATAQPKKGLSLTRDQMMEAQEMFRVSNKVSRPEKALILGFMAGSRENPCPQQGSVLNIKLSENEEVVGQADGTQKTVMVDTYFQMNYDTGEWKRFKKYRAGEAS
ncbi:negative elongation factor A-like [Babylonia areolata]|uniref:negative elongation factor A-like n=1 Tax=Babylonia areolata TaxID=304850 RepID=UPI003FD21123